MFFLLYPVHGVCRHTPLPPGCLWVLGRRSAVSPHRAASTRSARSASAESIRTRRPGGGRAYLDLPFDRLLPVFSSPLLPALSRSLAVECGRVVCHQQVPCDSTSLRRAVADLLPSFSSGVVAGRVLIGRGRGHLLRTHRRAVSYAPQAPPSSDWQSRPTCGGQALPALTACQDCESPRLCRMRCHCPCHMRCHCLPHATPTPHGGRASPQRGCLRPRPRYGRAPRAASM